MVNDRRQGDRRSARKILSIRGRLVALAMIAVVPLVLNEVRRLEADRTASIEAAHREVLNLARQGAENQNDAFETARTFLHLVARVYPQYRADHVACGRFLADLVSELPWIRTFGVADQNGRVVCTANPASIGLDISDRPHFQRAMRHGGFAVSDYAVGRRIAIPAVFATYAEPPSSGPIDAVFVALVDLSWIGRLAQVAAEQSASVVLMIDGRGTVLTRYPEPETWVGHNAHDNPLVDTMLLRTEGTATEKDLDGVRRIFGFVKLPGIEARFAVGLAESEVLRSANREASIAYAYLAAIAALVFAAIWLGGEQLIARPIRSLVAATQRVGRGDAGPPISNQPWTAEFTPLAAAMDDMASKLARREHELRASNSRLEELACLDELTGVANRRGFEIDLRAQWRHAAEHQHPLALLMIDIDHFKLFNDTQGHMQGDDCLRWVSQALTLIAKDEFGLPARYGGEEFTVLLPNASLQKAIDVAERIRIAVERLDLRHDAAPSGRVTVSIGVASLVPASSTGAEHLVQAADANLYLAKHNGRNTVVAEAPLQPLAAS